MSAPAAPAAAAGKSDYKFLSTTGNRKVHFEFAVGASQYWPSCNSGGAVIERLAALDEDGGLNETLATLLTAGIAPSRVCRKCFGARLVSVYVKRWADHKNRT